jgi:hypothetical protein
VVKIPKDLYSTYIHRVNNIIYQNYYRGGKMSYRPTVTAAQDETAALYAGQEAVRSQKKAEEAARLTGIDSLLRKTATDTQLLELLSVRHAGANLCADARGRPLLELLSCGSVRQHFYYAEGNNHFDTYTILPLTESRARAGDAELYPDLVIGGLAWFKDENDLENGRMLASALSYSPLDKLTAETIEAKLAESVAAITGKSS